MPDYSGKFQYCDANGAALAQGACRVGFDEDSFTATPASGAVITFDLGDVDVLAAGEWEARLSLYTGKQLVLGQFGAAFDRMTAELSAAWRDRTVKCLLLEDLREVARYNGTVAVAQAAARPAEIRIYQSNLAVLPAAGAAFQWRLADIDSFAFDERTYTAVLESSGRRITFSKLAKKTDEFVQKLGVTLETMRKRSAGTLRKVFPFLDAERVQQLLRIMPEGRSVRVSSLAAVHPKLPAAVLAGVEAAARPYFDALSSRAAKDSVMAGFKFVMSDGDASDEDDEAEEGAALRASDGEQEQSVFWWFFFPLPNNLLAWEAGTGSGRATYFFRGSETSAADLTRGLALVNFRREPVYLPDESLERQPRYHRYAIGARKLPELRALRAGFAGRAVHSSIEEWTAQVRSIAG